MIDIKSYAIYTNNGPHLNLNEDAIDIDVKNKLLVLADGYGGSNIGDMAAKFVVEHIVKNFTKIAIDPDSTLPFFFSHKYLIEGNAILNALLSAHQKILHQNASKHIGQRAGVSIIVGAVSENIITLVSTGTCYVALIRNGKMIRPLIPDSLDLISSDGASISIPASGVGLFDELSFQVKEIKINKDDILIFLTDGIYSQVRDDEILEVVSQYKENDEIVLNRLIELANSNGNLDNQSGILIQF